MSAYEDLVWLEDLVTVRLFQFCYWSANKSNHQIYNPLFIMRTPLYVTILTNMQEKLL
jgi:hypothetical protein